MSDTAEDLHKLRKEIESEKQALLMHSMKIEKEIKSKYDELEVRRQKLNESAKKLAIVAERVEIEKRNVGQTTDLVPVYERLIREILLNNPDLAAEVCMEAGISPDDFKKVEKSVKS